MLSKAKLPNSRRFLNLRKKGKIKISVKPDAPVKTENLESFLKQYDGKMQFVRTGTPGFELKYEKHGLIEKDEVLLLEKTEQLLCDMEVLF